MSAGISYSPESMTYTLFDGTNSLKLPNWARKVMHDEFEREVRPLRNSIDILSGALDANRKDKARLSSALKALMVGTYFELCVGRDAWQCCECFMREDNDEDCVVTRAMELLGVDMYGEPLEAE